MMFWERTGHAIADILICMVTPDDGLLLFEEKVKDWLGEFMKVRNQVDD